MKGWVKLGEEPGDLDLVLAQWIGDAGSCVDPYWLMAEAMDFAAFPKRTAAHKLPVMVERADGGTERFVLEAHARTELPALIKRIGPNGLKRFQLASPRTAGITESAPAESDGEVAGSDSAPRGNLPVALHFGVIDDGFPFAHSNLLMEQDRPLISSIWDQTGSGPVKANWTSHRVGDGDFGRLLTRDAIERVLGECRGPRGIDEPKAYAKTGYRVNQPGVPHGCGVIHMLAGRSIGLPDGSRAESPPVSDDVHCVQLPTDGTLEDTAGGWLGYYALAGIRHIIRSVQQETRRGPWRAIINLSYGSIAGPHDGTSMFEEAIDATCARYHDTRTGKVEIVVAAGNTRGKRIHAQRKIEPGRPGSFRFFTPPDNPRESYLELWIPNSRDGQAPSGIEVKVTAPTGAEVMVRAGEAHLMKPTPDRAPCAGVAFSHHVSQGTNGTMFLLLVRPTQSTDRLDRAPAGVWNLSVSANDKIEIHGWVERNDMVVHHRRIQQARFVEDPRDVRHVNDDMTLSSVAGAKAAVVVGAVRRSDGVIADYCGVDLRCPSIKPDLFSASDASPAMPGVLVPGFFSGATTRMSGTSIAAPRMARWLAAHQIPKARDLEPAPATGAMPRTLELPATRTFPTPEYP